MVTSTQRPPPCCPGRPRRRLRSGTLVVMTVGCSDACGRWSLAAVDLASASHGCCIASLALGKTMPVFTFKGQRDGLLFHDGSGYYYHRHTVPGQRTYLRCCVRKCSARGIIDCSEGDGGGSIRETGRHNHPPNMLLAEVAALKARILHRCRTEATPFKIIFNEEVSRVDANVASQITAQGLSSSMKRARASTRPPMPATLEEYASFMSQEAYRRYCCTLKGEPWFLGIISSGGTDSSAVFLSPITKKLLNTAHEFHLDATFRFVPKSPQCLQMLTLSATFMDHPLPVAFALMTERTEAAYVAVLERIREEEKEWTPQTIITDFEDLLTAAIRHVFGKIKIRGCWYHYIQALWTKLKSMGLIPQLWHNGLFMKSAKMAMALPLLPPGSMTAGLLAVRKFIEENLDGIVQSDMFLFVDYIYEFWIERIGPQCLSLWMQPRQTSNDQETFHSTAMSYMGASRAGTHPEIWTFTSAIQRIESEKSAVYVSLSLGVKVEESRKGNYIQQFHKIQAASECLTNGRYTVAKFLSIISSLVANPVLHGDEHQEGEMAVDDEIKEEDRIETEEGVLEADEEYMEVEEALLYRSDTEQEQEQEQEVDGSCELSPSTDADTVYSFVVVLIMDDSSMIMQVLDDATCTECQARDSSYICIPCGHYCLCEECAAATSREKCPVCEQPSSLHAVELAEPQEADD